MNSSTAWNGVTKRRLKAAWFFALLVAVPAGAAGTPAPTSATCQKLWRSAPLGTAVLASAAVSQYLKQNKNDATVAKALQAQIAGWSADFILGSALELEQRLLSRCPDAALSKFLVELQRGYLRKLGWETAAADSAILFKGLLNTGEEIVSVREKLAKLPKDAHSKSALAILSLVYGDAALVRGVLVVGAAPLPTKALDAMVLKFCGETRPCPLWDPLFLSRVALLPVNGFASFVPELSALRLSRELVENHGPLHPLVVAHELAHSAHLRARQLSGEDWRAGFAVFSQWKNTDAGLATPVRASPGAWDDALAKASVGSTYSLLPDPPFLAYEKDDKMIDGFVFARGERETRRSGDVGEDIADHVAAYVVAPERFCFHGKPVAPQKYRWVSEKIFGQPRSLKCP